MSPKRILILTLSVFLAAGAFAQGTLTTALNGTVRADGSPMPGVSVTVTSPNLQGSRSTVTGEGGTYSFAGLPPGLYTVTFELEGMQTVKQTANLTLSTSGRVDANMSLSAVAEAITITAAAPSVLETPQISSNFDQDEVNELPIARNPLAVAALAPGVLSEQGQSSNIGTLSANQVQISGSPGFDNLIMVNGVVVTENLRSQAGPLYIEDAIQETTVLTGAISAEFGRFTGGVINTITRSGGNEFTGSLRDNFDNSAWTDKTDFPNQADPTDSLNETYEGTLGGYILRDRLWFFGAGRFRDRSDDFATILPPGTTGASPLPYTRGDEETRYEIKGTGQIGQNHSLVASYLNKERSLTNTRFTANIYDLDSLTMQDTPETLTSVFYNGVLTSNFLVEAQYSARTLKFENSGSQYTDLILGTLMRDSANGNARFNSPTFCGVCDTESRDNDSILLKGNYFLSTGSFGSHNFVMGLEDFHENRYANNHQSGSDWRVNVSSVRLINGQLYPTLDASAGTYIRWTPIFLSANENDLQTQSLFVNDKWDLNRNWSFNLGLRFDKNHAEDGSGIVSSDDSGLSPRLTAIYDVKGDGRHRVTASYNTYVSRIIDGPGTAGDASGSPGSIDFQYRGPVINAPGTPVDQLVNARQALQMMWDWFLNECNAEGECGEENLDLLHPSGVRALPGYDFFFDGSLTSPSVDEIAVGYGLMFGRTGYAKFDAIQREWKDFYGLRATQAQGQITDPLGIQHDRVFIVNTDDIEREYKGLQMQAGWRPRGINLGMTYTWSELTGNDETETATSGAFATGILDEFYPELAGYANRLPTGYLDGFDIRHKAKLWAGYDWNFGSFGSLNTSILHSYRSGTAYSTRGLINMNWPGAPETSYEQSALGAQYYYFEGRGNNRTDDIQSTDLGLNYRIPLWKVEMFVEADVLNLFNEQGIEDLNNIGQSVLTARNSTCLQTSAGPTPGARCLAFNPFTDTPVEGVHYRKAATFGQALNKDAFQLPTTYRFSVGVRF